MIIKLWRNQTAGALQPRVNNVLLTKKTKVVQEDASITPNKLRTRSSHCLPLKVSAKLVLARANLSQVSYLAWFIGYRGFILYAAVSITTYLQTLFTCLSSWSVFFVCLLDLLSILINTFRGDNQGQLLWHLRTWSWPYIFYERFCETLKFWRVQILWRFFWRC